MKLITFDRVVFYSLMLLVASAVLAVDSTSSLAQAPDFSTPPSAKRPRENQPARPSTSRPKPQSSTAKKSKFPDPEVVELETKDGVKLTCTWFPPEGAGKPATPDGKSAAPVAQPSPGGKTTAPFILLHDWDRSRTDLLNMGRFLQVAGHGVIVPDLRGHGDSLTIEGSDRPIDRDRIRKKDLPNVLGDIEACKKFLMRKNDEGVVNIDLLNMAAVGQTAILAMQWAVSDWSWAPVGSIKQGQDVKSLILIAPKQKIKGVSAKSFFKHPLFVGGPADPLPLLVLYSESHAESVEDSNKIYEGIEKGRSRYAKAWRERAAEQANLEEPPSDPDDPDQAEEGPKVAPVPPPIDPMKTFVNSAVPRENKSGSALIASRESVPVFRFIDRYVKRTILSRQAAYPWQKRLDK